MEGELTCSVCLELFEQPLMLSCGHNFCRKCVRDVVAQRGVAVRSFPCPTCRKDVRVDHSRGLDNLPRNIALENIVKMFRSNQETNSGSFILPFIALDKIHLMDQCARHKKPMNLYCQMCKVVVCELCGTESHSSFGHNAKPSPQILKEEEYKVKTQLRELELWFQEVKERQDCLDDTKKSVDAHQRVLEKQLEHDCQGLIELIFSKQHELKASLMGDLNQLKSPLSENQAQLRMLQKVIEDIGHQLKDVCKITNPGGRIQALEKYSLKLQTFLISKPLLIKQPLPEVEIGSRAVLKDGAEMAIKAIKWKVKGPGNPPSNKAILKSGLFGSRQSASKSPTATAATKTPDLVKDSAGYSFGTAPLGAGLTGISSGFFNISAPMPSTTLSASGDGPSVVFTGASNSSNSPASGVSGGLFSAGPCKQPFRPSGGENSTLFVPATGTSLYQARKHSKTSSNARRRVGGQMGGTSTSSGVMSSNFVITLPSAGLKPSLPSAFISAQVPTSGSSATQPATGTDEDSSSVPPGLSDSSAWLSSASAYISQQKAKSFFGPPTGSSISPTLANNAHGQPARAETRSKWCYPPFAVDSVGAATSGAATTTTEPDTRPSTESKPTASAFGSMFAIPGSFSFKFSPANVVPNTKPDLGHEQPDQREAVYFEPINEACISSTSARPSERTDRGDSRAIVDTLAVQVDNHLTISVDSATASQNTIAKPETANSSAFGVPYLSPSSSGAEADSESDSFAPDNADNIGDTTIAPQTITDRRTSDLASVLSDSIHNSSGSSSESFSSVKSQPEDGSAEGIMVPDLTTSSSQAEHSSNAAEDPEHGDSDTDGEHLPTEEGTDKGDNSEKIAAAEPKEEVRVVKESYQRDEPCKSEQNGREVKWNPGSYVMLHNGDIQALPGGLVATASCNHTITLAVASSGQQLVQTVPSDNRFNNAAASNSACGYSLDKATTNGFFSAPTAGDQEPDFDIARNVYYKGIPTVTLLGPIKSTTENCSSLGRRMKSTKEFDIATNGCYQDIPVLGPVASTTGNSSSLGRMMKKAKRLRRVRGKDGKSSNPPVDDKGGYAFNVPTSGTTVWTFASECEHGSGQSPFVSEEVQSEPESVLTKAQTDHSVSSCKHTDSRSINCRQDDNPNMSDRKLHEQEDLIDRARQYMQEAVSRQREILDKVTANLKHTEDVDKTG